MKPLRPLCTALALALVPQAPAFISANLTPVHLVKQSGQILLLEIEPIGDKAETVSLAVVKCLKGRAPEKRPLLDLRRADKAQAAALRQAVGARPRPALLFAAANDRAAVGLLHVGLKWFRLNRLAPRRWQLERVDEQMQPTWAGSTEMLRRTVGYVLSDPRAAVPTEAAAKWGERRRVGKLAGPVHGASAVDLAGAGRPSLVLQGGEGDRVYDWEKDGFRDRTGERRLTSRSRQAAWADFNGDGRLDLASWDGKELTVWLQGSDGTFAPARPALPLRECLGLAALDVGTPGRAGLLVSTRTLPLLLTPRPEGGFTAAPLPAGGKGAFPGARLGEAHACLVADFDGDGVPDVLQPFARGGLFYKGKGAGRFEAPKQAGAVGCGERRAAACAGDFDGDGRLDVLVTGADGCRLWHNEGGGTFREAIEEAGEPAYQAKPGAAGGQVWDVNGDGRPGFLVLYADRPPQVFFNRGFQCFGLAASLALDEDPAFPEDDPGQQAGVLARWDGGAPALVVVLKNGEVWALALKENPKPIGVRVSLPARAGVGPARVVGYRGRRCLGAWSLSPGGEAFLGVDGPGPCTVRWQLPGGREHAQEIFLKESVERLVLGER